MTGVGALVLAAGQGTRYRAAGGAAPSKLVADLAGQPVIRHVVRAVLASRATPVIVVTGHARDHVVRALSGCAVTFRHNETYAEGLAGSLKAGVSTLPDEVSGAVVLLGDMPGVTPDLIDALVIAAGELPPCDVVVPVRHGRRGNPVVIGRSLFSAIARLTGDAGARGLLAAPWVRVRELAVDTAAVEHDIDLPSDLLPPH